MTIISLQIILIINSFIKIKYFIYKCNYLFNIPIPILFFIVFIIIILFNFVLILINNNNKNK